MKLFSMKPFETRGGYLFLISVICNILLCTLLCFVVYASGYGHRILVEMGLHEDSSKRDLTAELGYHA